MPSSYLKALPDSAAQQALHGIPDSDCTAPALPGRAAARILLATPAFSPSIGGIETYVSGLSKQLVAMGLECEIAHVSPEHSNYAAESVEGTTVHRVPANGFRQAIWLKEFSNRVGKFDVINVNDPHQAGLALHFAYNRRQYGRPRLLLTTHGGFFHTARLRMLKHAYFAAAVPWILRRYDKIICVSRQDFQKYREAAPEQKLTLLENGVNVELFDAVATREGAPLDFVYFGRLSPNKNVPRLVEVFMTLQQRVRVRLHIVGDGRDLPPAKQIAANSPDIIFHPFLAGGALREKIASCRYFVTASKYEGFGLSIVEAMAAGRIVICNDIAPIRNIVDDQRTGFLLDFREPIESICGRLLQILATDTAALQRIRAAAGAASRSYSWRARAEIIRSAFLPKGASS